MAKFWHSSACNRETVPNIHLRSAGKSELSKVLSWKPADDQHVGLHALPATKTSSFLFSAFPFIHFVFFQTWITGQGTLSNFVSRVKIFERDAIHINRIPSRHANLHGGLPWTPVGLSAAWVNTAAFHNICTCNWAQGKGRVSTVS